MEEVVKQVMKLKIALVKHIEPMVDRDGNRTIRATYSIQYLTRDNYVLAERQASEFDRELFERFVKSP